MARQPRVHVEGYPIHLFQRGHSRERCFFNDDDYARYRVWLADALLETECDLHAYVLMLDRVHLLVTACNAASALRLLMSVGRRYIQYVNKRYGRSGTVWEPQYRSSRITTDDLLLACHRYIEMNPVRAGIVSDPADYRWSSYGANALGRHDAGVTPHPRYTALGANDELRRAAYRTLFDVRDAGDSIAEILRSLQSSEQVGGLIAMSGQPLLVRRA